MNLKDIDYKQFFLEKGEKVGVGVAVGLMSLLIIAGLFLPSHGFFSGSPSDNAKALKTIADNVDNGLRTNRPGPNDLPPTDSHTKLINLETTALEGDKYQVAGLFEGYKQEATKKRLPQLKNVDEARVAYAAPLLDTYVFTKDFDAIYALKPAGGSKGTGLGGADRAYSRGGMGGPGGGRPGAGGPGSMPGSRNPFSGQPAQVSGLNDKGRKFEPVPVKLTELAKHQDYIPARQLQPLRLAEIVGSFPLRDQIEEFRIKLGLNSASDVLALTVPGKDGKSSERAFRFMGVRVQRRTLDPSGKPSPEGYQELDLAGAFKPWLVVSGKRYEAEDPALMQIRWPGLVMDKLLQFRNKQDPTTKENTADDLDNHYPDLEKKVAKLVETLNSLKTTETVELLTPPQFDPTGWDPFNAGSSLEPPKPSAIAPKPPTTDGAKPGATPAKGAVTTSHCLVRVFDPTIEPGKTYQYRLQVRMANPLFGHSELAANPDWANEEELKTDNWFEVPETVSIPPELAYYAVDQKELDGSRYKGPNPYGPGKDETTLQIHRWLDTVVIKGMGNTALQIGEWAVADRVVVARGEYVDRVVHIELPVWSYTHNDFVLATDSESRRQAKHGFNVPFSHSLPNKYETILIDFDGGRQIYKQALKKADDDSVDEKQISDNSAIDVLLMDPYGRLLGHNSALDTEDPDRESRRKQVQARVERVKESSGSPDAKKPDQSGDKPFGK
jgi:hypothetical protein